MTEVFGFPGSIANSLTQIWTPQGGANTIIPWTRPDGPWSRVQFVLVGGGGGAGSGRKGLGATVRCAGGAGGSAGVSWGEFALDQLPEVYLTIGAGGAGGASQAPPA